MEKIWLSNYPADTPAAINPDEYCSLTELLIATCKTYADKPAFQNFGKQLTYQELMEKSLNFAAYLQKELGLVKGDRIAIMLPNLLQYPIALLAALHLGLVIVNINPLYTERELLMPLQDSGAKAIIVLANFADGLVKVLPQTQLKHIIVTELADELPTVKRLLINSYLKYIKKTVNEADLSAFIPYREVLEKGKNETFDPIQLSGSDIAFLQYTGGTTGKPKGAMLTHRNLVANLTQSVAFIGHALTKGEEIIVAALPLYHIFSLTVCCFAFMKLGGLAVLITNPRDLKSFIKQIHKLPFTVFVGVNTLFYELMRRPDFKSINFSHLKLSIAGGMSVNQAVADQWTEKTGDTIIMGYGLTEASPIVTINPLEIKKFTGSIGIPVPSTEVAILDNSGQQVPQGSAGELCIRGPQVMLGYWHQIEETNHVLQDGWLRTGDIVFMDEQGFIYLIDRKKDMILVSGFNVYPNEIEAVISSLPGVAEVAVIGIPSTQSGEVVKAFIVKNDTNLTEADVIKHCKQNLTGYKQPRNIEFRDMLPKSNVGKILKCKLRETTL